MRGTLLSIFVGTVWASAVAGGPLVITDLVPGTYVDISTSGVALALGDEGVAEVWPGFTLTQTLFSEGGGRCWISNNGAIGFLNDGGFGAYFLNEALPSSALYGAGHGTPQAIAVYWDDLDSDTGDVYQATTGSFPTRVFIVQWQDRPHFSGNTTLDGDEVTFQAQIFEEQGPIKAQFVYQDVSFLDPLLDDGASATIGYQAGAVGQDVPWSHNQSGAVTAGTVLTLLELPGACVDPCDGNGDCHIDGQDLLIFDVCMGGPSAAAQAGCECYDIDADNSVGLADFGAFQDRFTGPSALIPGCTP